MEKMVILIDDDQDDLDILKEIINGIDSTILCQIFTSPEEALPIIMKEQSFIPDFIFIDFNMPKMSGEDCLAHLRKIKKLDKTIITMLSTSMPPDVETLLMAKGANFAIQKASKINQYTSVIHSILALKPDVTER